TAPRLLASLGVIGMIAMFLVGGGILTHSLPFLPQVTGALAPLFDAAVGVVAGALVLAAVLGVKRARQLFH
ncbi:MAG: DUF808 domain-containing protein, partial [Gammaproteobacteria bacterium]